MPRATGLQRRSRRGVYEFFFCVFNRARLSIPDRAMIRSHLPARERIMHILLRVLVGTVALLAVIAPAAAASRADWDACKGNDPDQSIAACTRIIQGRGETAKDSAIARRYRGLAYQRKDDLDRAIADYSEPSGSIPNTPRPTMDGASLTGTRAISSAPSPTTARRSGSIPSLRPPTTTGATRTGTRTISTAPSPTLTR